MWQHHRDEPASDNCCNIIDFPDDNNNSASFKFKQKITQTENGCSKDDEIMVPLKYLSNFWRTLKCLELIVKLVFSWNGLEIVL